MSIQERQKNRLRQKLIEKQLRAGRPPLLTTIEQAIATHFARLPAGRPRFQPKYLRKGYPSDPDQYNEMMEAIREDLETATDEVFEQQRRMLSMAEYYESEKNALQRTMNRMGKQMEALLERVRLGTGSDTIFDSFTDFGQVEFIGDQDRNLPETTAMIDLSKGEVTLWPLTGAQALVDLSTATARTQIKGTYVASEMIGHPENALSEHINTGWHQVITRNEADELTVALRIELPEARAANMLTVWPQMPKEASVRLLIRAEGEEGYRSIPQSGKKPLIWTFPSTKVKEIVLEFTKSGPDFTVGAQYEYRFGVQRIRLQSSAYVVESRLVSTALPLREKVRSVTLTTEEVRPAGTEIRYYVALDTGAPLDWREITPGEPLELFDATPMEDYLAGPYSLHSNSTHGVALYEIGTISDTLGLQVYAGEAMWLMEWRNIIPSPNHEPSMADWVGKKRDGFGYSRLERADLPLRKGLTRWTLWVDMPEERVEKFTLKALDCKATVYLNNERLRPEGDEYTYRFKAGMNQIVIYVSTNSDQAKLIPGLYFDATIRTYAHEKPMRLVSIDDLSYLVGPDRYLAYAAKETPNGTILLVNYDPTTLDVSGAGLRYLASYALSSGEAGSLRFMALLRRQESEEDITPRLRSYKIQVN